ncbi:MAG: tetratricopeptide repeat protein [Ktedonobacterales bacterium]
MSRMGSGGDWGDSREMGSSRSGRGGPQDSGIRRNDQRGRARLSNSQVASALREAQQLQQEDRIEEAVQLCEELIEGGVDRADVHYFLGWLYQESDRWDEAASEFELLLEDPDYALSCYYALGQCARAQGNIEEAARYFDEAVDRVNLDALTREESDQLLQLCQEAAEAHREMDDIEGAETVYTALLGYLRSQGWQDQVAEIERLMRETLGTNPPKRPRPNPAGSGAAPRAARNRRGAVPLQAGDILPDGGSMDGMGKFDSSTPLDQLPQRNGLSSSIPPNAGNYGPPPPLGAMAGAAAYYAAPASPPGTGNQISQLIQGLNGGMGGGRLGMNGLSEPQRSQVEDAVRDIENYVAHGLLTAAIEECLRVMEMAPQYLDVHLMLGEIYVRQGKIEQAIAKYAVLIDIYLAHNRIDDAISTYQRILQLEPNNLTHRVKLIELLKSQGRMDEVQNERMLAADSYLRLGYADRAIQEYEQALMSSPSSTALRLSYATALMRAGQAARAAAEFQRVLQVEPGNIIALSRWQIVLAQGVSFAPAMSIPGLPIGATSGITGITGTNRQAAMEVLGQLLRAMRAEGMRSYEEVAKEYLLAIDTIPGNPDLRYALGEIQLFAGRQAEALSSFQQIALAPGFELLGRYGAGQALLLSSDSGSAAKAVRELEEASAMVRRSPPDPALWAARPRGDGEDHLAPELEVSTLLARAYQLSGQIGQLPTTLQGGQQRAYSDEVYRALAEISARQLDPQSALQEYAQLVRHYRNTKQQENAVGVLKEMSRVAPDDPAVHSELADIHISRGLLDEGLTELRQLADIHTRRGQVKDAALVYQRMADIDWSSGEHNEALNLLRQAIQFSTDDMSLRQQFVQYCLETGRGPEAAEQQTVIARYYFASRQTKEAVAALQQLIGMDPHNYEAYDLLGQTYYSVGEYEQATRVYRNLAKVDPTSPMARARLQELQAVRTQMH